MFEVYACCCAEINRQIGEVESVKSVSLPILQTLLNYLYLLCLELNNDAGADRLQQW